HFVKAYGENSSVTQRYFASFTQMDQVGEKAEKIRRFISVLESTKEKLRLDRIAIENKKNQIGNEGFLSPNDQQQLDLLSSQERVLGDALRIVKTHSTQFAAGKKALSYQAGQAAILESSLKMNPESKLQIIPLADRDPFIHAISIDWGSQTITFE